MYSFTIIETENQLQARLARLFLETSGYPSIATTVNIEGEFHSACFTAAPHGVPEKYQRIVKKFASLGEAGWKLANEVVVSPEAVTLAKLNRDQIPADMRDAVRNSLLHTLYTAAGEEHSEVVFCEPAYSTVTATPTPVKNPEGGGFDGDCVGADKWRGPVHVDHDPGDEYDSWRPNRAIG